MLADLSLTNQTDKSARVGRQSALTISTFSVSLFTHTDMSADVLCLHKHAVAPICHRWQIGQCEQRITHVSAVRVEAAFVELFEKW